jgi:glycosyltransferase involved in cell wall biosynthesis
MSKLPKISCFCATYGRPYLLEEAIYSFLQQDYAGEKELVILNDLADQTLIFDHPDVIIVNTKDRITPLGKKFNSTVALCSGEYVTPWEDDDIYLKNKLSVQHKYLNADGIFHTSMGYIEESHQYITRTKNLFQCNMLLRRDVFDEMGGYEEIKDRGTIDSHLISRLILKYGHFTRDIPDRDQFYVYRWGTADNYHASGWGSGDVSALAAQVVSHRLTAGQMASGEIQLNPRWKYDYERFIP